MPVWSKLLEVGDKVHNLPFIAVDRDGNVVVAGNFSGSLGVEEVTLAAGTGVTTPFVVKLSPSGALLWAQRFETLSSLKAAYVEGLATDPAGNVAVTGHFSGSVRIGDVTHAASSSNAFYVTKLAASTGSPLWRWMSSWRSSRAAPDAPAGCGRSARIRRSRCTRV
ncbi:hypothetical protein [Archangium sp.]|uniref:hypothetical protein n=1 Tax=Archangium sp. TaxID=1872627 RepID=UPI002EDA407F